MLAWFCISIVGYWIAGLLRGVGLGFLDRIWGAIIGFGKALILAVVVVSILTIFLPPGHPILRGSILAPHVGDVAQGLIEATPGDVRKLFNEKRRTVEREWLRPDDVHPKTPGDGVKPVQPGKKRGNPAEGKGAAI